MVEIELGSCCYVVCVFIFERNALEYEVIASVSVTFFSICKIKILSNPQIRSVSIPNNVQHTCWSI